MLIVAVMKLFVLVKFLTVVYYIFPANFKLKVDMNFRSAHIVNKTYKRSEDGDKENDFNNKKVMVRYGVFQNIQGSSRI